MYPSSSKRKQDNDHKDSGKRQGSQINKYDSSYLAPPAPTSRGRGRSMSPGRRGLGIDLTRFRNKSTSRPEAITPTSALPIVSSSPDPPDANSITMNAITLNSLAAGMSLNMAATGSASSSGQTSQPGTASSAQVSPDISALAGAIRDTIESLQTAQSEKEKKKWTYINRHGEQVAVGDVLGRLLRSVDAYAQIVDVAIQHHPDITALVWSGIRLILKVSLERLQLMETLEFTLKTIIETMATCEFYAKIFDNCLSNITLQSDVTTRALVDRVGSALGDLYLAVRDFTLQAWEYFNAQNFSVKVINLFIPFSVKVKPALEAIQEKKDKLREYADMATMKRITDLDQDEKIRTLSKGVADIQALLLPIANCDQLFNESLTISTAILDATTEVRDKLSAFQVQVVKTLRPYQQALLSATALDAELQHLRDKYFAESAGGTGGFVGCIDVFDYNLYIPARGMLRPHEPPESQFDLSQHLEDHFLLPSTPSMVCLIQGTAGSGKSTFNHYIARRLWDTYDRDHTNSPQPHAPKLSAIPVFITLANLHNATQHNQDLIGDFFRRLNWGEPQIIHAKKTLQFVFILDGYDEIEKRDRNFFTDCRLGEWNAKTIVTSRPEYLGSGYRRNFQPPGQPDLLQECWLAPFSEEDIRLYIRKYVNIRNEGAGSNSESFAEEVYEKVLSRPEIQSLVSNPFLLRMVMSVKIPSIATFNRVTLYRLFLQQWLDGAYDRLCRIQLPRELSNIFIILREGPGGGFVEHVHRYCQEFAVTLYCHHLIEATYKASSYSFIYVGRKPNSAEDPWAHFLADDDPGMRLSRFSSPLLRNGSAYRFLHKSLRDYLVAEALWEDPELGTGESLLNQFNIIDDPGVIDFVVQQAHRNQDLQKRLLQCIEASKGLSGREQSTVGAANAITILVRAGRRFGGHDLRGISVRGADLRQGWFEQAQLQGADLRRTKMNPGWFRGANLANALMEDVVFGERPEVVISLDGGSDRYDLRSSNWNAFSKWTTSDGLLLAIGRESRMIEILSVTDDGYQRKFQISVEDHAPEEGAWSSVHSIPGLPRTKNCWKIVFSPDGSLIAAEYNYSDRKETNIYICSVVHGCVLNTLQSDDGEVSLHLGFSDDNRVLTSVTCRLVDSISIKFWSVSDGLLMNNSHVSAQTIGSHLNYLEIFQFPLALSEDSKILAIAVPRPASNDFTSPFDGSLESASSGNSNHTIDVLLWSCVDLQIITTLVNIGSIPHFSQCKENRNWIGLELSPDNEILAVRTAAEVYLCSIKRKQVTYSFKVSETLTCTDFFRCNKDSSGLIFSRDSHLLAVVGPLTKGVELWSLTNGYKRLHTFKFPDHPCVPEQLILSENSNLLAVIFSHVDSDGTLVNTFPAADGYYGPGWISPIVHHRLQIRVFEISATEDPGDIDSCIHYYPKYHIGYAFPSDSDLEDEGFISQVKQYLEFSPNAKLLLCKSGNGSSGRMIVDLLSLQSFHYHYIPTSEASGFAAACAKAYSREVFFVLSDIDTNGMPNLKVFVAGITHKSQSLTSYTGLYLRSPAATSANCLISHSDELFELAHEITYTCFAFSPITMLVATGNLDGNVQLWLFESDPVLLVPCNTLYEHSQAPLDYVTFSLGGHLFASGSNDGVVRVWKVSYQQLAPVCFFEVKNSGCKQIKFSPNGKWLAISIYQAHVPTVRVCSLQEHNLYYKAFFGQSLIGHPIKCMEFSPDSKLLVVLDGKLDLHFFSIPDGSTSAGRSLSRTQDEIPLRFRSNSRRGKYPIISVAWSAHGPMATTENNLGMIAVGTADGIVEVWNVKRASNNVNADLRAPLLEFTCHFSTNVENRIFNVGDLNIDGVRGLRGIDIKLLEQCGVIGTPAAPDEMHTEEVD